MIMKTLFVALAGATVWKLAAKRRSAGPRSQTAPKPQAENQWEGEGGALQQSGAQLGPKPSVVEPA